MKPEEAIKKAYPNASMADVMVHIEPEDKDLIPLLKSATGKTQFAFNHVEYGWLVENYVSYGLMRGDKMAFVMVCLVEDENTVVRADKRTMLFLSHKPEAIARGYIEWCKQELEKVAKEANFPIPERKMDS